MTTVICSVYLWGHRPVEEKKMVSETNKTEHAICTRVRLPHGSLSQETNDHWFTNTAAVHESHVTCALSANRYMRLKLVQSENLTQYSFIVPKKKLPASQLPKITAAVLRVWVGIPGTGPLTWLFTMLLHCHGPFRLRPGRQSEPVCPQKGRSERSLPPNAQLVPR